MKLFVSYARVDNPYCQQIVKVLQEVHEVWYDKRLFAGQDWWNEILSRIDWCEGFVYLLSPESVASEYCQREFELAQRSGKYIFPVLIQARTEIPKALQHLQYANLSESIDDMRVLLNALTVAERSGRSTYAIQSKPKEDVDVSWLQPKSLTGVTHPLQSDKETSELLTQAGDAMEAKEYDQAVFLLKQIQASGTVSKYVMESVLTMLKDAEAALEQQAHLREAQREYAQIVPLVNTPSTRERGCEAFERFSKDYPFYDPAELGRICYPTYEVESKPASDKKSSSLKGKPIEPQPLYIAILGMLSVLSGIVVDANYKYISSGRGASIIQIFLAGGCLISTAFVYNRLRNYKNIYLLVFSFIMFVVTFLGQLPSYGSAYLNFTISVLGWLGLSLLPFLISRTIF